MQLRKLLSSITGGAALIALALFLVFFTAAQPAEAQQVPTPAISSINPNPFINNLNAGTSVITITGSNFTAISYVEVNGVVYPPNLTHFIDSQTMTIDVDNASQAGNYGIVVVNFDPANPGGSPKSNSVQLAVVPPAPANLSASALSATEIRLSWTDVAPRETGYRVERSAPNVNSGFSEIATPGANATSYLDSDLLPNTTYYYRVRTSEGTFNSGYSNTANATTQKIILENAFLKFEFGGSGLLQTIVNKQTGYSYSIQHALPWQLTIHDVTVLDQNGDPSFVLKGNPSNLSNCSLATSGVQRQSGFQTLNFTWTCSFQTSAITVTAAYELKDSKDYLETWSTANISSSRYSILKIYYPLGVKENPALTEYGITSGYVFEATREAAYNVVPFESFSLHNIIGGQWDTQGNYLYFMTDDDGYGVKTDSYETGGGIFITNMIITARNYFAAGNNIDAPYRLRIGVGKGSFTGEEGWLPMADIYRKHLQDKGTLSIPVSQRADIPDYVKNLDMTIFTGPFPYPLISQEQQQLAAAYRDAKNYYGAQNLNLFTWENGSLVPLYEPLATQVDFYKALRSNGVVPCMYTPFSRITERDPAYSGIRDEANFVSPLQPVVSRTPFFNEFFVHFDPTSDKFINWFVSRLKTLSANGTGLGCIYQDDTYVAGGRLNGLWNPALNSIRKYGLTDDVLRGGVQYYGKIGSRMNTTDRNFFLFHESFVTAANFVGGPDVQSSRGFITGSNAHPLSSGSMVPNFFFLERVFSGYNLRKGASIETANLLIQHPFVLPEFKNADPRLAGYPFDIFDDFPLTVASAVLEGGGLPITPEYGIGIVTNPRSVSAVPNYKAASKTNWYPAYFQTFLPEQAEFHKEMVKVVQLGRQFFQGQWQPSLPTDSPQDTHKFINWAANPIDILSVQKERVISGVWKAWNGELGLLFANHYKKSADQTVTFTVNFGRYGLQSGRNYQLAEITATGKNILGNFANDFNYALRIPARKAIALSLTQGTVILPSPNPPSNLVATPLSATQVKIAWTDNANNEDGFKVERSSVGSSSGFSEIAGNLPPNTVAFSDNNLSPNTTYWYRVRAYNTGGDSSYSNVAQATTKQGSPGSIPNAPDNLSADAVSPTKITLKWRDNSDNEGGFLIQRKVGATGSFSDLTNAGINATTTDDLTVSGGQLYGYRVRAFNAGGTSAFSNEATVTTPPSPPGIPNAPSNLVATPISATQVRIAWSDNSANELGFKIERSLDGTQFAELETVPQNFFFRDISNLAPDTTYFFRIRAYNAAGNSAYSNTVSVRTPKSQVTIIFTINLYRGLTHSQVGLLQQCLKRDTSIYPEGIVSNFFGGLTEKAVQRFQAKQGIVSSGSPATTGYGFVGPRTRVALNTFCQGLTPGQTFTKDLFLGMRDAEVSALQGFLKKNSAIYPEGRITGYFGSLTQSAVKRFQAKYGIAQTGRVDLTTRNKLNELYNNSTP